MYPPSKMSPVIWALGRVISDPEDWGDRSSTGEFPPKLTRYCSRSQEFFPVRSLSRFTSSVSLMPASLAALSLLDSSAGFLHQKVSLLLTCVTDSAWPGQRFFFDSFCRLLLFRNSRVRLFLRSRRFFVGSAFRCMKDSLLMFSRR